MNSRIWKNSRTMRTDILRINSDGRKKLRDTVADEVPLTITLNGKELLTLLCSPSSLKELSAGFLYTSGIIKSINDIKSVVIDKRNMTSFVKIKKNDGRILKKKFSRDFKISAGKIMKLMNVFEKKSSAFKDTGGVHSAGFTDGKKILIFKEDIGRHNALDKAIGEALMKKLNMEKLVVLTSGRISSEIMFKVRRTGVCIIVSRGAPTDQSVKLAKKWDLTLAGFVRGKRMNVYSSETRILIYPTFKVGDAFFSSPFRKGGLRGICHCGR